MARVMSLRRRQDVLKQKKRRKYMVYTVISVFMVLIAVWIVRVLYYHNGPSAVAAPPPPPAHKDNSLSAFLRESKQKKTPKTTSTATTTTTSAEKKTTADKKVAPPAAGNDNDNNPKCDEEALVKYLPNSLPPRTSLKEKMALARARFALKTPYDDYPEAIRNCELGRDGERVYNMYHDMVLKPDLLGDVMDLTALSAQDFILDILKKRNVRKKIKKTATIVTANAGEPNHGELELSVVRDGHTVHFFGGHVKSCQTFQQKSEAEVVQLNAQDNLHVTCIDPTDADQHPMTQQLKDAPTSGDLQILKIAARGNEAMALTGFAPWLAAPQQHPRFVIVQYNHGWMRKINKQQPVELLEMIAYHGYVCTTLGYSHWVDTIKDGKNVFGFVDTPEFKSQAESTSVTVPFEDLVESISNHNRWKLKGTLLPSTVQRKAGWTNVLCIG
jgi:hypothetical protein